MGMQFARIVQSYIWVKDVWGMGRNADHGAGPTKTRVLTGAALKNTGLTAVLGLCATDHTIQVDPGEVHLVRAHFAGVLALWPELGAGLRLWHTLSMIA